MNLKLELGEKTAGMAVRAAEEFAPGTTEAVEGWAQRALKEIAPDSMISVKKMLADFAKNDAKLVSSLPSPLLAIDKLRVGSKMVLGDGSKFMVHEDGTFSSTFKQWNMGLFGRGGEHLNGIAVFAKNGNEIGQFLTKDGRLGGSDWVSITGRGAQNPELKFGEALDNHRDAIKEMYTVFPNRNPYARARSFSMETNAGTTIVNNDSGDTVPFLRDRNFTGETLPQNFFNAAAKDLLETKDRLFSYARILERIF